MTSRGTESSVADPATEEAYTLADMFRATASLIRTEHGPTCPDHRAWLQHATHLEETADRLDRGEQVNTSGAYGIANAYLTASTGEKTR
ncbi:hypothetical protein [uncultured Thermomonospora sp.]|uniref:hypothetical protein n=1 Tax=uncultured Thermomonospora sp. TaxID=671175 RepID=UPI00259B21F5|nr:hypothetical protein [uncultured Thermomonospora sp.]